MAKSTHTRPALREDILLTAVTLALLSPLAVLQEDRVDRVDKVDSRVVVLPRKWLFPSYIIVVCINSSIVESSPTARSTHIRLVVRGDLPVEARMMMMSKCSSHLDLYGWC